MERMSRFLYKQGGYLLQNTLYASALAAALAFVPFSSWLSGAIVALITLRRGSYDGFKVLIASLTIAIIASSRNLALPYSVSATVVTFLMVYSAACLLRMAANWTLVVALVLGIALLGVLLVHCILPSYIAEQFQTLLMLFKNLDQSQLIVTLLDGQHGISQTLLANYLLGIKALTVVCSALFSLMLARYTQSLLVNPGGFREEILAFRATRPGLFLLVFSAIGVYQNNAVAVSWLPLLVIYLMAAGMCLFFNVVAKKRDWVTIVLVFSPLILAPYIMLLVYVLFGSLDSLFNFRLRLLSRQVK